MKFYKRDPDRALSGMAELNLRQRGAYNSLLDLLYSRDGDVPDDDVRVARMISCHWREWAKVKAELMALGKVWSEGGKLRAKRVQETIRDAADFAQEQSRRAAKGWQKRKKIKENNDPPMPPGNASTATATAREEKEKATPSPKRGSRLPSDWVLPREWAEWAISEGMDELGVRREAERFRDYWHSLPGQRGVKLDWLATWRNWIRKATERGPPSSQPFDVRKALGG